MCQEILNGIFIGAAGGASAGLIIWGCASLNKKCNEKKDKKYVYDWLYKATKSDDTLKWRSTRAIASFKNLTEDRVRYICSKHDSIVLSTKDKDKDKELWGIKDKVRGKDSIGEVKKSN